MKITCKSIFKLAAARKVGLNSVLGWGVEEEVGALQVEGVSEGY